MRNSFTTEEINNQPKPLHPIFTAVSSWYDLVNRIITLGLDNRWRRLAAAVCMKRKPAKKERVWGMAVKLKKSKMKHKVKKYLVATTLLTLIISLSTLQAQEVIATGGNHHEAGDISVSWTLGETVIETFMADENILTQGFHQPKLTVVSVDEIDLPGYNITAFPNPTNYYVTLRIEPENFENISFQVFDFNGRFVKHKQNQHIL